MADTRPHQRRNRREQLSRVEAAQDRDSDQHLEKAAARFRSALTRRLQPVFDELCAEDPGPGHLRLMAAVLMMQATEEVRLKSAMDSAIKNKKHEQAEGIQDQLAEHRRTTRHLKSVSDGIARLVKVQAEIDVGNLPTVMRIVGAGSIAAHYAEQAEPETES